MEALTPERASRLLPGDSTLRALVVGDLMIDRYIVGTVDRVSPEAPVPIVHVQDERSAIGGAGNVAANLSALGLRCTVAGCLGDDPDAAALRDALERAGVRVEGVVDCAGRRTTVKTRVVAGHQQVVRFDHEVTTDLTGTVHSALLARVGELVAEHDVVVIEDYNKGVVTSEVIDVVLSGAAAAGIPSVVDPKRRNFFRFAGATAFKPNVKEVGDAFGEPVRHDDPEWMERARRRLGCEHLVLTLGSGGIVVQSEVEGWTRVPAVARAVFDVSGAGDTVSAVVAATLAAGGTPVEAAMLANHAAAVCVSRPGVVPVSREEVLEHLTEGPVTKAGN